MNLTDSGNRYVEPAGVRWGEAHNVEDVAIGAIGEGLSSAIVYFMRLGKARWKAELGLMIYRRSLA